MGYYASVLNFVFALTERLFVYCVCLSLALIVCVGAYMHVLATLGYLTRLTLPEPG